MKTRSSLLAAAGACATATLLLAACGGGGGGPEAPTPPADPLVTGTDVPTSATASAAGAFAFAQSVAATTSETGDPLVLGDATLATSEVDDPSPI